MKSEIKWVFEKMHNFVCRLTHSAEYRERFKTRLITQLFDNEEVCTKVQTAFKTFNDQDLETFLTSGVLETLEGCVF